MLKVILRRQNHLKYNLFKLNNSTSSNTVNTKNKKQSLEILNKTYETDEWTNLNKNILSKINKNIYKNKYHPLNHLINQIKTFFYTKYVNRTGNPSFSIYEDFSPIVTVEQNFDSILIPKNHVSRSKHDCYYVNKNNLLRSHTSSHQSELIKAGLNSFLCIGDVYRRDEIDSKHYPVFHQCEGVRIFNKYELFKNYEDCNEIFNLFEIDQRMFERNQYKQSMHTMEAAKLIEYDLKKCLVDLVQYLFGSTNLKTKWIDTTFPFTHPSWELEIEYKGQWYEVLGCGIIEQEILNNAGASDQVGWAFGLGLERWAMILYDIPDIRLFWTEDESFIRQFKHEDSSKIVKYKPISLFPVLINDISFWIPNYDDYNSNRFYDIVRDCGGDLIEHVELVDKFYNAKKNLNSHCYRITYRSMDRTLTQEEISKIHKAIENEAKSVLNVTIR